METTLRRFSLMDVGIAVAASAATFAIGKKAMPILADFRRGYCHLYYGALSDIHFLIDRMNRFLALESKLGFLFESIAMVWLFAFAAMRIRRPRPCLHLVLLQPGMVAFWAASMTFALGLLLGEMGEVGVKDRLLLAVMFFAVPISWETLKLTGNWRPEASWVDGFGRTLGFLWWGITWARAYVLLDLFFTWGWPSD